ncbi:hypothetical protein JCM3770_006023 [Rhodotorula araucariae]
MTTPAESDEPVQHAQDAPAAPEPSSPSPPLDTVTAAVPASDASPQPTHPQDNPPRDPKVAQLKALFPDLEEGVLEAVLEGSAGSLDEATEQLLVMSDPNFKTDTTELSQLEADEEFARQLAREEELSQVQQRANGPHRSARTTTQQQLPGAPSQPLGPLTYQPYVPKSRRTAAAVAASPSASSWQPPPAEQAKTRPESGQAHQRDELQELTEQFNKVADTGKRMFGSFLSKAKEQIARVDEAIVRSASPPTRDDGPAPPPKPAQPPRTSSTSSWTTPSPLPRPPGAPARSSLSPQVSRDGPIVMIDHTGLTDGRRPTSPGPLLSEKPNPPAAPEKSVTVATASTTAPESPKKDFSKQIPGLLPRQSFSLLDATAKDPGAGAGAGTRAAAPSPSSSAAAVAGIGSSGAGPGPGVVRSPLSAPNHALGDDDESDDELEYTRSPFDDD